MGTNEAHLTLALLKVVLDAVDPVDNVWIFCIRIQFRKEEIGSLGDFLHTSRRGGVNAGEFKVLGDRSAREDSSPAGKVNEAHCSDSFLRIGEFERGV